MKRIFGSLLLVLAACTGSGDGDDEQTAKKRLYQTGCTESAQCADDLVCATQGSGVCLEACDAECENGSCIEGICYPACGDAACPGELVCEESRCVAPSQGGTLVPGCQSASDCGNRESHGCIMTGDPAGNVCAVSCEFVGECEGFGGTCVPNDEIGELCQVPCPEAGFESCPQLVDGQGATGCTAGSCDYGPPAN